MRIKNILKTAFLLVFISCSEDNNQVEEQPQIEQTFSEIYVNGVLVDNSILNNQIFYKVEDEFYMGVATSKTISFNENGDFGSFKWNFYNSESGTYKWFYSYRPYSSNFFKLNIEEIDEVNKKVKINFNGAMYGDPNSLQSEGKYVSGRIVAKYVEVIPSIFGLKNTAKINGQNWIRTNSVQVNDGVNNFVNRCIQNEYNDKEYRIKIYYQIGATVAGTYNFTSTDQINKVEISKYDLLTNSYTDYNCMGQLKILNTFERQIKGEYSFTGINPNNPADVVTVTNGEFKIISLY